MRTKITGLRSTRSGRGLADGWPVQPLADFVIGR